MTAVLQAALFGLAFAARDGAATPSASRLVRSPALFCVALGLMLLSGRWPWLAVARELNPDESCFLAQAWRYTQDVVPWRATHSGTSGPLTPWLLAVVWQCGAPLSYPTAHVTAAVLQIFMLCLTFATLRMLAGDLPARLATMPVAFLLARTGDPNFFHLSSEHVPLVLLAGCACAAAAAAVHRSQAIGWLLLAGALAGAVPFAKLQAVPLALALTLIIAAGVWQRTVSARDRLRAATALAGGGLLVPAGVLGLVVAAGAWDEFWSLYIQANLAYGDPKTVGTPLVVRAANLIAASPMCMMLGGMTAAVAGLGIGRCVAAWRDGRTAESAPALAGTVALLAVTVFSVAKPGYAFRHYLLLLTLPCMLVTGASLATTLGPGSGAEAAARRRFRPWAWASCAVVAAVPALVAIRCVTAGAAFLEGPGYAMNPARASAAWPLAEARVIADMTLPGDEIAVWGWRPDIYIAAGRRPAVREVESSVALLPGPFQDAARRRFLQDMERNKPRLFVDAVCWAGHVVVGWKIWGPELVDIRRGGHETFPELRDHVARHYVGREQVLYYKSSVRIYERRDAVPR